MTISNKPGDWTLTEWLGEFAGFCAACAIVVSGHATRKDESPSHDGACLALQHELDLVPMMPLKTENCDWEGTWEEWVAAYRTWMKFQENLANNLRIEGLTESDAAIKEAVDDCEVTAAREVHGNYSIFVASKGADHGPEIYCWLDRHGELQAEENLDESETERDVELPGSIDR